MSIIQNYSKIDFLYFYGVRAIKASNRLNINEDIRSKEVRLIKADGEQAGVVDLKTALATAREANLDLVEIVADAKPPVCKVMDYKKYLYEQKQKAKEAKKNQKQTQLKEIKLRPGTEEADYQVKLRKIIEFLQEQDKVKVSIRFRGREMAHQQIGLQQLERIITDTTEYGNVEQAPKLEGRQMGMLLGPTKKK
ncbi:translation initiation factor IF-3 [Moraxella macacae 0408225]|uniref:Translation initiation factor IF-3 n=1 Tax=Moraxella macacae 0408225 TaxID=1230338 RepID=L2F538_9GAMM|nr:translation initiation factor IF-3 [Moraxella macacae 0408225]